MCRTGLIEIGCFQHFQHKNLSIQKIVIILIASYPINEDQMKKVIMALFCSVLLVNCGKTEKEKPSELTPEEARKIAKEAYIYGYPMVDGYRIIHAYFVNEGNPEYKGPLNTLSNSARVYTYEDKAVQTPNSDTPYSMLGMDLRTEPFVLTVPKIDKNRYFSIQLVDTYTHNFDYIGSRATGNEGGSYLIAGPDWNGETPPGITKVIKSETNIALAIYRTQLFHPADLPNVIEIQKQYRAEPLSVFLKQPAPAAAPEINFMTPCTTEEIKTSLKFFEVLNFLLKTSCPTVASEKELMERFAKINVGPEMTFDEANLTPEIKKAIQEGMQDALKEFQELKTTKIDTKEVLSGDLFGTRDYLKNNYMYRMAGAIVGIYGNTKQEAMYPLFSMDSNGNPLSGEHQYEIKFEAGKLPPVNSFWSLTMYEMPSSLLIQNPINRYLINSPMLPQLKKDADGGVTLYIQKDSPGKYKESVSRIICEKLFKGIL